jgi:molecular chaperone GrpE (heat shock protein)
MNKKWVKRSSALMLVGIAGLAGALLINMYGQRQTARYKLRSESRTEDYFGLYDDQGRVKTQQQLKLERQARLKADIADLAEGVKTAPIFSELIYGDNWHEEVSKYKSKIILTNYLLGVSIISILAGLIIGLTHRGQHIIPASFGRLGRLLQEKNKAFEKNTSRAEAQVVSSKEWDTDSGRQSKQCLSDKTGSGGERSYFGRRRGQNLAGSLGLKDSLGRQAQDFGSNTAQFPNSVFMSTEPVTNTLDELTQEVSAIREFAAHQQDRVRQLQEGYDWTIIKRFCLRIIRCIDNLDDRISKLNGQVELTQYLEDVRDELVFALESSGVEQFEPQIDADYKGLEKTAEAVHERERSDQAHLSGKIAKVVRSGYQYVLNDNDVKIVRAAQVKLYL